VSEPGQPPLSAVGLAVAGVRLWLSMFIVLRLLFVGWRTVSGRWAVTGK
jgi:hypothetical protein